MRLSKKELAMWKSLRFGSNSVRFWPQASAEEKKAVDRYAYSRDLTPHIAYICQALNLSIHAVKSHSSVQSDRILDPEFRALLVFTFGLFPITSKLDELLDEATGSTPTSSLGTVPTCFNPTCKNTENLGLCQGCCVAVYCGTACQRKDWGSHMTVCFRWKDYYQSIEDEVFKHEPIKIFVRARAGGEKTHGVDSPLPSLGTLPRSDASTSLETSPDVLARKIIEDTSKVMIDGELRHLTTVSLESTILPESPTPDSLRPGSPGSEIPLCESPTQIDMSPRSESPNFPLALANSTSIISVSSENRILSESIVLSPRPETPAECMYSRSLSDTIIERPETPAECMMVSRYLQISDDAPEC